MDYISVYYLFFSEMDCLRNTIVVSISAGILCTTICVHTHKHCIYEGIRHSERGNPFPMQRASWSTGTKTLRAIVSEGKRFESTEK